MDKSIAKKFILASRLGTGDPIKYFIDSLSNEEVVTGFARMLITYGVSLVTVRICEHFTERKD